MNETNEWNEWMKWMNEWMNEMNEGVLIRSLGKWMAFWRPLGLALRGRVRWGELSVRWGVGAFAADPKVDSYFCFWEGFVRFSGGFWMDFWWVWGPADRWLTLILLQRRFCENPAPVEAKLLFLRFRACKKRRKIEVKLISKKLGNIRPKMSIFGAVLSH